MLVFKYSSPYSSRVTIHLGTTVLDTAMARIAVEELVMPAAFGDRPI